MPVADMDQHELSQLALSRPLLLPDDVLLVAEIQHRLRLEHREGGEQHAGGEAAVSILAIGIS